MEGFTKSVETMLRTLGPYLVPNYQRGYKWRAGEAAELWNDLIEAGSANETLFLGTILTQKNDESGGLATVDGQQRLTTILLLLAAAKMQAIKIGEVQQSIALQEVLSFKNSRTGDDAGFRLQASPQIRDVFEHICSSTWNGEIPDRIGQKSVKLQSKRLRPVYSFFAKRLSEYSKADITDLLDTLYSAKVVHVEVNSLSEAIGVFERTNARGADLEVADLLKNHLIGGEDIRNINERWDAISSKADGQLLKLIKYFYVSQKGYTPKAKLYTGIKTVYANRNTLVIALEEFAHFFELIKLADFRKFSSWAEIQDFNPILLDEARSNQLAASCHALVSFGHRQFIPLFYASLMAWRKHAFTLRTDDSLNVDKRKRKLRPLVNKIFELFDACERFHFINSTICGRPANEVERLYADQCKKITEAISIHEVVKEIDEVIIGLRNRKASRTDFADTFCELRYDTKEDYSTLQYVFDRMHNFDFNTNTHVHPEHRFATFNTNPILGQRSWTIEHFFPQNPDLQTGVDRLGPDVLHNIGNLLLLHRFPNNKLENNLPKEKVELLRGVLWPSVQNSTEVVRFLDSYGSFADSWGEPQIEMRAKNLADECYEKVFMF